MIEINGISYEKDELAVYIMDHEKYKTAIEYLKFRNVKHQKVVLALEKLIEEMDTHGDVPKIWVKDVLKRVMEAGNG